MLNKYRKDLVYFKPGYIKELCDKKGWSERTGASEIIIDKKTLQAHWYGKMGCRKPTFMCFVKTFDWEKIVNSVHVGFHLVEIWYREKTGKDIYQEFNLNKEEIKNFETTQIKESPQEIAPHLESLVEEPSPQTSITKLDKTEFLKPLVEEIEKQRKGKYFIERIFLELTDDVSTRNKFTDDKEDNRLWDFERILKSNENIIILGEPGSGKTTLLHDIILNLYKDQENDLIPIYISFVGFQPKGKEAIINFIQSEIQLVYKKNIIKENSDNLKYIFLFDHIDLVASSSTKEAIDNIKLLFSDELFCKYRFIVTCRINQYLGGLSGFIHLKIKDLSDKDIESILIRNNIGIFWQKIKKQPTWTSFTKKPLLLTMLINVYKESSESKIELNINRKTDLYSWFVYYHTSKESIRERKIGETDFYTSWKLDALYRLAFEMQYEYNNYNINDFAGVVMATILSFI